MATSVGQSVHHFGVDINMSTIIGWIVMKFQTNTQAPLKMNPTDFGDHLTFPLAPPAGQNLSFSVKYLKNYWMDCHEIGIRQSCSPQDYMLSKRAYKTLFSAE